MHAPVFCMQMLALALRALSGGVLSRPPLCVSGSPQCTTLASYQTKSLKKQHGAGEKAEGSEGSCLLSALLPTWYHFYFLIFVWAFAVFQVLTFIAASSLQGRFVLISQVRDMA